MCFLWNICTIEALILLVEPDRVQINAEADFWLDVAVFEKTFALVERIAGQELDAQKAQAIQNAVKLYQDPLLESCYEDWCLYERERLQNMCLTMLNKLMSYYEVRHDYDSALLIKNSWGSGWGDQGYGWLPYEYVLRWLTADWWSIIRQTWIATGQFGF